METFLQERGLKLSQEKTRLTSIREGFDFLGQNVRKYPNGKLLIKPAKTKVRAFLAKVRKLIKSNSSISAGKLILLLNPVLKGWANYHRHVVSKKTFKEMSSAIFRALWRWIKRRHSHKGWRWRKQRYFKSVGLRNWVFFGQIVNQQGQRKEVELFNLAGVAIKRHTIVRSEANPYDPCFEEYFDQRLGLKWLDSTLYNRKKLIGLWKEQQGECPICHQKITKESGWNLHHLIFRVNGGTDKSSNLILLHPNCHRQVHSQGLTVEKPGACQPRAP